MRRTLLLLLSASVLAAACGSDAKTADTSASDPVATDVADTTPSNVDTSAATDDPDDELPPPPTSPDKPTDIDVPGEAPTELNVDVLSPGSGPVAETGDTVIVDYIGVRALDGVEFDNSYDRFTPFSVGPLGSAPVIPGWNEGLLGAQEGARLQLDIPSDLAYGPAARSELIRENEPLTFVIDVRSVIKPSDPADAPTEAGVEPSDGATELSFEDLIEGDGAELVEGQTAIFHIVLFRADNGVELDTTWEGEAIQLPMAEGGFPAIVEGMPGMHIGGRRAITAPPELGFGPDGNPQIGLPADVDIVLVVDLLGAY
ncbi:MAG: hypothetical protein HKN44_12030 [Ilumatobacter sp.]|nr:hypothetical protein [Ilumatobacter sp.]